MPQECPLFDGEAPHGQALPYGLFHLPAAMQDYTFSGPGVRTAFVQLDLYAPRDAGWDLFERLTGTFDDCAMPVEGLELLRMERGAWHRETDQGAARFVVSYTVQLQPL